MKNHTEVLIFHTAICVGASQISLDGRGEIASVNFSSPRRIRSGMEIIMKRKHKGFMSILLICAMLVSVAAPAADSRADSHQKKKGLYEGDGYQVLFDVTEMWEGQYNASITITNTGWQKDFGCRQSIQSNAVRKTINHTFSVIHYR